MKQEQLDYELGCERAEISKAKSGNNMTERQYLYIVRLRLSSHKFSLVTRTRSSCIWSIDKIKVIDKLTDSPR